MKKFLIMVICLFGVNYSFGQSTFANNQWTAPRFLGYNGSNGISPLFFRTNDLNRMKINGNLNYAINGYAGAPRNGNVLIGVQNNTMNSNMNMYTGTMGAYSLLHLNGTGLAAQEFGYRPWMNAGVTMTENSDFAYFGLRKVGTAEDHSETTILWADNGAGNETWGPDNMVFRFSGYGASPTVKASVSQTNLRENDDLDGLHVATFNPTGYFGLGNTFGMNDPSIAPNFYVRPQSLMHMSYDYQNTVASQPYGFMQITARRPLANSTNIIGQGEAATDGLRLGIDYNMQGSTSAKNHLNGVLRWQEASSFIIQTEDDVTPSIQNSERLRVTSIGALNSNYTTAEYLGNTIPANSTRVSISADANRCHSKLG
jgi:hypothetical protein